MLVKNHSIAPNLGNCREILKVHCFITEKFRICLKAEVRFSKSVLFLPSYSFSKSYIFLPNLSRDRKDAPWDAAWDLYQPHRNSVICSTWVISPSTCTFPWFRHNGILLWASLGHMCTSVGHGGNAGTRLNGGSTSIMEIEEGVVPKWKECEQTK